MARKTKIIIDDLTHDQIAQAVSENRIRDLGDGDYAIDDSTPDDRSAIETVREQVKKAAASAAAERLASYGQREAASFDATNQPAPTWHGGNNELNY